MLKSTAHDLRGALVGVGAGLKLLGKGYYGRMDPGVSHEVQKLKSDVVSLEKIINDLGVVDVAGDPQDRQVLHPL